MTARCQRHRPSYRGGYQCARAVTHSIRLLNCAGPATLFYCPYHTGSFVINYINSPYDYSITRVTR